MEHVYVNLDGYSLVQLVYKDVVQINIGIVIIVYVNKDMQKWMVLVDSALLVLYLIMIKLHVYVMILGLFISLIEMYVKLVLSIVHPMLMILIVSVMLDILNNKMGNVFLIVLLMLLLMLVVLVSVVVVNSGVIINVINHQCAQIDQHSTNKHSPACVTIVDKT